MQMHFVFMTVGLAIIYLFIYVIYLWCLFFFFFLHSSNKAFFEKWNLKFEKKEKSSFFSM